MATTFKGKADARSDGTFGGLPNGRFPGVRAGGETGETPRKSRAGDRIVIAGTNCRNRPPPRAKGGKH